MGRKKQYYEKGGFWGALKKETFEGISAIIFILIAIFLFLSSVNKGGPIGDYVFRGLTWAFGIGYYLIPVILIILGVSFIKSLSHNLAWPKIIGGVLMMSAGLGLIDLLVGRGGVFGAAINKPLLKLFGTWMVTIGHFAVLLIATLIIFDLSLRFSFIQNWLEGKKKKRTDEFYDDIDEEITEKENQKIENSNNVDEDDDAEDDEAEEEIEPAEKEEPKKEVRTKAKEDGLVFFSQKSSHFRKYSPPPLSLLEKDSGRPGVGDIKANANIIKRTLANFGIQVEMDEVSIGPSVTRYALKPAQGVKLSRIVALQSDLSLALAAKSVRIEAPIPGKSLVGIEIPNSTKTTVGLGSVLKDEEFEKSPKPLLFAVGRGVTGISHFVDLAKMPHLLIAGATGSGKSVTIHEIITSLLYRNSPELLKFIMIDPKRVELTMYNKIPHLLTPVITDAKKTIMALKWAGKEMSRRYDILESSGVRDISSYHKNILEPAVKRAGGNKDAEIPEKMPYIIIVIDELADIMQAYPRELESAVVRLAQMSRAVGVHLIISTQRPSVDVITGLIKANIPSRIALQVASQIDSRTILDMPGAEKLLGSGDMLYLGGDLSRPVRVQSPYISEEEVKNVVDYIVKNNRYVDGDTEEIELEKPDNRNEIFDSLDEEEDDDLYEEAKEVVISAGKASTSYLQRKLGVGYSRAAKIMDILESRGVIGPQNGAKPRDVLVGSGNSDADSGDDADTDSDADSDVDIEAETDDSEDGDLN
ncbi:MAG TPA: DNA translocase FtsK 4TM domain-containing protein [Candidatus Paceibacterota bacterium]|nr:DNA translocase FtsK 4TM domain-containing protein [Candidatus Paceibacterota bacterium]HRZ34166.1 DNA translocase FtsK 4TM domain-containing protein [Candidatus Paceibacterota bacterium]